MNWLESERAMIGTTSTGRARSSTRAARSPLCSVAPSAISTGRSPKYVYGVVFCTITVTPATVSAASSASSRGGWTR